MSARCAAAGRRTISRPLRRRTIHAIRAQLRCRSTARAGARRTRARASDVAANSGSSFSRGASVHRRIATCGTAKSSLRLCDSTASVVSRSGAANSASVDRCSFSPISSFSRAVADQLAQPVLEVARAVAQRKDLAFRDGNCVAAVRMGDEDLRDDVGVVLEERRVLLQVIGNCTCIHPDPSSMLRSRD